MKESIPLKIRRCNESYYLRAFWEKLLHSDAQHIGEYEKFAIGHPPQLSLDFGKGCSADIPTRPLQNGSESLLGHPLFVSNPPKLRADNIANGFHVPERELDNRGNFWRNCS